jgi:DNA-directed RNA polymerase specialized sigma24 family protein
MTARQIKSKMRRTDLGLAIAEVRGGPMSAEEIAAFCDCSRQSIQKIESRALLKLRPRMEAWLKR